MGKEALVVKRDILFKEKYFQGFLPLEEYDYIPIILKNYFYETRGDKLENDASLQQIIPYVWIINPQTKKVFGYTRTESQGEYKEQRLLNKVSCGVGGHIDKEDVADPIMNAMMREMKEEVVMSEYPIPKFVGYINDDEEPIGKVHFGIVALVPISQENLEIADGGKEGKWYSIDEFDALMSNTNVSVESWTRISWPFVKAQVSK